MQRLLIPVVTALVALVVGASAIGDEREDGTILYLAATPLPRLGIVVAKIARRLDGVRRAARAQRRGLRACWRWAGDVTLGLLFWPAAGRGPGGALLLRRARLAVAAGAPADRGRA